MSRLSEACLLRMADKKFWAECCWIFFLKNKLNFPVVREQHDIDWAPMWLTYDLNFFKRSNNLTPWSHFLYEITLLLQKVTYFSYKLLHSFQCAQVVDRVSCDLFLTDFILCTCFQLKAMHYTYPAETWNLEEWNENYEN